MRRLSYEHCPSLTHLLGVTIGEWLRGVARAHPEREAVVSLHQGVRLTYAALDDQVDRVARALLGLGVKQGDRVAIWSPNCWEWIAVQYACARVGAVLVTINPAYREREMEFVLKESKTKVLFSAEFCKTSDCLAMVRSVCPEVGDAEDGRVRSAALPELERVVVIGEGAYEGMHSLSRVVELAGQAAVDTLQERESDLDYDDPINIQYTSGTTGFPKGVTLSHHNILNNGHQVALALGVTSQDRMCIPVPFYHCFSIVLSSLLCVSVGATQVLPSAVFEPGAVLRAVTEERCTVLHGVPTMFIAELEHPDFASFDMSSLRTGIMAGAPCPVSLMKAVVERMHLSGIQIGYGQTEAAPLCTLTMPGDPFQARISTVGKVLPHQEIRIAGVGGGSTLPRGQQGEICVRGYHVMVGYDGRPEATQAVVDRARWLHTGDLGVMDDDGFVSVTGRIKDLVIRGGENIYPREIEDFLHELPMLSDVYVVGVPDARMGEELLACVKLRKGYAEPTAAEFREMCRGKISYFKVPRYWMVVDEFPMTVTGKVQKFRIRQQAIEKLHL